MSAVKTMPPKRAAERIRETAEELFYREGIRAVGVDEIVSRAGVTKPSLYRSYSSKDDLAADYLRHHAAERLKVFDALLASEGDLRANFRTWLKGVQSRTTVENYRGCGNSNAVVEYPQPDHPAHITALETKHQFRARYRALAAALGAAKPAALGDMLMLLIEGAHMAGQMFGPGGPSSHLVEAVDSLFEHYLTKPAKSSRKA